MKPKAEDLVRKLKTGEERQTKKTEWGKCDHKRCPLLATVKAATVSCTYHHGTYGQISDAISASIHEHIALIKKLNSMALWDSYTWRQRTPQILGWDVLPMTEGEPPTMYLQRFRVWVTDTINSRADEIMRGH